MEEIPVGVFNKKISGGKTAGFFGNKFLKTFLQELRSGLQYIVGKFSKTIFNRIPEEIARRVLKEIHGILPQGRNVCMLQEIPEVCPGFF